MRRLGNLSGKEGGFPADRDRGSSLPDLNSIGSKSGWQHVFGGTEQSPQVGWELGIGRVRRDILLGTSGFLCDWRKERLIDDHGAPLNVFLPLLLLGFLCDCLIHLLLAGCCCCLGKGLD